MPVILPPPTIVGFVVRLLLLLVPMWAQSLSAGSPCMLYVWGAMIGESCTVFGPQ